MSVEGSGLDGGLRCHPDRSNTSPILNSKDISLKIGAVSVNISGFFSTLLVIRTFRHAHKHLISGKCLSQAISKSMTALGASSFLSVFKEGWLRLNKKFPFLSGADGVVSKFQQK